MFNVKTIQETLEIIQDEFKPLRQIERVSLDQSYGRMLATDIVANQDIPPFHRSSVDGYAVRARDTFGASESMPVPLALVEEIKMGIQPEFSIIANQASYIPTGGQLPEGSDAVVMIEYAEEFNDGFVYIQKSIAPGNNVIYQGDDLKQGKIVLSKNTTLNAQDVGILAALGIGEVDVYARLRVAIVSTGDEIVAIDAIPVGAQVRDVNAYVILGEARRLGCDAHRIGIVKDDADLIYATLNQAIKENDLVILSGGSSVGMKDNSVEVLNRLGEPGVLVHGIAVKPGKPTLIAKAQGKAILGLPGHPASAFVIFRIFGKAMIEALTGNKFKETHITARLSTNIPSNHGRAEYIPIRLEKKEGEWIAHPLFGKSGMISLLSLADGYLCIERESEGYDRDRQVDVVLYRSED